jgi:phosphoribosyl 1,2-cyclic phosphodiesterase
MLNKGNYPYYLKKRISSDNGHLSNTQALELFMKHKGKQLSHLILSHLSKNNNSADLVSRLFNEKAGDTKVIVASRYGETPLFCIEKGKFATENSDNKLSKPVQQLSLF